MLLEGGPSHKRPDNVNLDCAHSHLSVLAIEGTCGGQDYGEVLVLEAFDAALQQSIFSNGRPFVCEEQTKLLAFQEEKAWLALHNKFCKSWRLRRVRLTSFSPTSHKQETIRITKPAALDPLYSIR